MQFLFNLALKLIYCVIFFVCGGFSPSGTLIGHICLHLSGFVHGQQSFLKFCFWFHHALGSQVITSIFIIGYWSDTKNSLRVANTWLLNLVYYFCVPKKNTIHGFKNLRLIKLIQTECIKQSKYNGNDHPIFIVFVIGIYLIIRPIYNIYNSYLFIYSPCL